MNYIEIPIQLVQYGQNKFGYKKWEMFFYVMFHVIFYLVILLTAVKTIPCYFLCYVIVLNTMKNRVAVFICFE